MKFGKILGHILRKTFGYRVIPDLTFGDLHGYFLIEKLSFLSLSPLSFNLIVKICHEIEDLTLRNNLVLFEVNSIVYLSYSHFCTP